MQQKKKGEYVEALNENYSYKKHVRGGERER